MNAYEEKRQARIDRWRARAAKLTTESDFAHSRAREMASAIPFGQPIHIGHHSEGRDRNYRARIHNTYGRAFKLMDKAAHYADKAYSAECNSAISSDDPDAVLKLEAKLAKLLANHAEMLSANKDARKNKTKAPYATYSLSLNNANMRTVKLRIEHLNKKAARPATETTHQTTEGAVRIFQNVEENRLQMFFDGKPSAEVIAKLKSGGFRWSPTNKAWQLHLSGMAIYKAQKIVESILQ